MALNFLLKRSGTASKRPDGASMSFGEIDLNYDAATGGLYYKNSAGDVVKVGPCQVSADEPNSSPAGSGGNSAGEFWFDTSTQSLKVYDGSVWAEAGGAVQGVTGTAPISVDNTDPLNPIISVDAASTTTAGVVQLNDTTSSTSTSQALTANQGLVLQQQIDALAVSSNLTFAGTIDANTGNMVTVSAEGALAGFTIGNTLPAASSSNSEYFVIVTVAGTMTPPGGSAQVCRQGDWWLSDGTAWNFLNIGYDAPYASTATPGVVQLATAAEVQAGVESTHAVTSSGLQSKVSDSVSTTSSTALASSTAAKTAYDAGIQGQTDAAAAQATANAALPKASYTAKGALVVGTGAGTYATLSAGSNGQLLVPNSACTNGVEWVTCSGIALLGYTCSATPFSVALGYLAGDSVTTGACNIAIGYRAGTALTSGSWNTFLGTSAGDTAVSTCHLTAIGANTLTGLATAVGSTAVGSFALSALTTGAANTAVGYVAGDSILSGSRNTILGHSSGGALTTTSDNTFVGACVANLATGASSTIIGSCAGSSLTLGGTNIFIGANSGDSVTTGFNNTIIGDISGTTTLSNNLILAAGTTIKLQVNENGAVGVGSTPSYGTAGQVLTSGGSGGVTTWSTLPDGTTTQKGIVQLTDSTSSTSTTTAATPNSVKSAYDLANAALPKAGGTMTGTITFDAGQTFPVSGIQDATTGQKGVVQVGTNIQVASGVISVNAATTGQTGVVQLTDSTSSTSTTTAATPNSVKSAYDLANTANTTANAALPKAGGTMTGAIVFDAGQTFPVSGIQDATTGQKGIVQVGTNIQVASGTISVNSASTTVPGVVQLNDTVTSTSTTEALTANQGYLLQQQIDALSVSTNLTLAGTIDASTGNLVTVTDAGTAKGFTVGSPLPASSNTNKDYFVMVTVAGTMTPPGGSPQVCHQGDWWISGGNGTGWVFADVGFNATYATTSAPGIVQLATNAEVQAGVNTDHAVVPSALQSKLSDSTSTTSSTTIASSTAVKSAYDLADAAIAKSVLSAKGDIISASAASTPVALGVGTNGQVLTANSACTSGLEWQTITQCVGTVTSITAGTGLTGGTITGSGTIALDTTCVIQPSAFTAKGDLLSASAASTPLALGVGTNGQVLSANSACSAGLEWVTPAATSAATPLAIGSVNAYTCSTDTNTAFGYSAAPNSTTPGALGGCNTFVGFSAGCVGDSSTSCNTAVGCGAMLDSSFAQCNVAIGMNALRCAVIASGNIAIGHLAMNSAQDAYDNIAIGAFALCSASDEAHDNIAIGLAALRDATGDGGGASGNSNVAIGQMAQATLTTGCGNVSVGNNALSVVTSGQLNVAIGDQTGVALTTGSHNIFLGADAGSGATTGCCNVAIGAAVCLPVATGSCQLALGFGGNEYWLTGCSSKAIRPGAGIVDCAGSCGSSGQVLGSTGSNAVVWQDNPVQTQASTKAVTNGTPVNVLEWTGGNRMGTLVAMAYESGGTRAWANITIASEDPAGVGDSAVVSELAGGTLGTFTVVAGTGGKTVVQFNPVATVASVDFHFTYTAAFGAQPTVL